MGRKQLAPLKARPMPPENLNRFVPADGLKEWINDEILSDQGRVHNVEHAHLVDADLEFLWAPEGFAKQGRTILGQAEMVMIRAGGWQKQRQEQQLIEWFGRVPEFIITLAASYCAACDDAAWCALVEHELYHVAQANNEFGAPRFTKDGLPKLEMRGHDVEEFLGVVRRYGVGDPNGAIAQLAAAARGQPEVSRSNIAGACGTCLLRAA